MIRRLLPLLLVAATSAQAAEPAARYLTRHPARTTPARQVTETVVTTPAASARTTSTATTTVTETVEVIPPAPHEPRLLEHANVLPLALDDAFEFRKRKITYYTRANRREAMRNPVMRLEYDRITHGAVSREERDAREGHYFIFWWRTLRPANVTIRLEYRQAKLGNYVQAREVDYPALPKGTHQTKFNIIGDDFLDDGNVTAWRALIIENNRIVATTQSFLWH